MTWLKYDSGPIFIDHLASRNQKPRVDESGYASEYEKPKGFWITDDTEDSWQAWCLSERFNLESLTHKHEVDLEEDRILILRSAYDVEMFASQYAFEHWWGPEGQPRKYRNRCIDWPEVASCYAGIIITPYQWSLRMANGFSWYYGWDCASGCIWDATAIKDVRLVEIDKDIASKARPEWKPDEEAAA